MEKRVSKPPKRYTNEIKGTKIPFQKNKRNKDK